MNHTLRFSSLFIILLLSASVWAQVGTQFWFAAPWMNSHHTGEAEFHVVLSAYEQDAHVRISQPANGNLLWNDTIVMAHSYLDLILVPKSDHKTLAETTLEAPYNEVSNRGLFISSDADISAYYQITHANGEAFTLKGENALGTYFVIMSQNKHKNYPNYNGYVSRNNSIQIVATEDQTEVTITPTNELLLAGGTTSKAPITITLNRGDTYAVQAASTAGDKHLIGTIVSADKPIAVTTADDSVEAGSGQDAVGDQLLSTDYAGTEYTVIPLTGLNYESLYILSLYPNTHVEIINDDDMTQLTLDTARQVQSYTIKKVTFIRADQPIQVFQFTNKQGESGGTVLPQMLCTGSRRVTYKRIPNSDWVIMNILTKTVNTPYFYINGNEIPAESFKLVPGTSGAWSYISLDVTKKPAAMPLELEATRGVFQLGVVDHASIPQGTITYGFFSNYGNASEIEVMSDDELVDSSLVICQGSAPVLVASAADGVSQFQWYRNGQLIYTGDTLDWTTVSGDYSGEYTVSGQSSECTVKDKFFRLHAVQMQKTIPLTHVVIEEGQSYTWPTNGKTYTTDTRDTVWLPVVVEDMPVIGCDTAEALWLQVHSNLEVTIDAPHEICGDDATFEIPYTKVRGAIARIEIIYSDDAAEAGWKAEDIRWNENTITLSVPDHVWANEYDATLVFFPASADADTLRFPIHWLVRYATGVFVQRWNDVLSVRNDRYNRDGLMPGYTFTAFQWYKNDEPIAGANTSYYYVGPNDILDYTARYYVLLTRSDGTQIRSCDYIPTPQQ